MKPKAIMKQALYTVAVMAGFSYLARESAEFRRTTNSEAGAGLLSRLFG